MKSSPKLTRRLLRVESDAVLPPLPSYCHDMVFTGRLKIPFVASLVEDLVHQGEQVLVVGVHEVVLAELGKVLDHDGVSGVEWMSVMGNYGPRSVVVERFRQRAARVLIAPAAGLIGAFLHKVCRHVVFAELDPLPGALVQAEARVYRAGGPWPEVVSHIPICDVGTDHEAMGRMGAAWLAHVDPALGLRPRRAA
jgi:hypothetical protein